MDRIHGKYEVKVSLPPADYTTATDGAAAAFDTQGYEEMLLLVPKGVVDDVTLNIDVQHSDDNSTFATIPAPANTGVNPRLLQFVNADDNLCSVGYFDLAPLKRYIKPVDTLNANSALYGLIAVLFSPERAPTSQTNETDAT